MTTSPCYETIPTKQGAQNVNIIHCRKICEIQRCIAPPNTILHLCNSTNFYLSKLVWTPIPNQFRYDTEKYGVFKPYQQNRMPRM